MVKLISVFRTAVHFYRLVRRLKHGSSYRRETKITSSLREVRDTEGKIIIVNV